MFILDDKTALIGSTDLRTNIPKVENMEYERLIVMKREKPVAVLMTFDQYRKNQDRIDELEDIVLGYMAKDRDEGSTNEDYISMEEVEEKFGLNL